MSDNKKKFKTLAKWFFIRIPLAFGILALMMIIALKLVERYPDPLREGIEEYLTGISGTNATIGHVETIKFFPEFNIFLHDITMHDAANAAIINLKMDSAHIRAPFWSMLISGTRLNQLEIINLDAVQDQITPLAIKMDLVKILDKVGPEQYGSFLIIEGTYSGQKMFLEAELKKKNNTYKIPNIIPFSLQVGQSSLNGTLVKGLSTLKISDAVFSRNGKTALAKNYILVESKKYVTDNPLSCLFYNGDSQECDIFLEEKDK